MLSSYSTCVSRLLLFISYFLYFQVLLGCHLVFEVQTHSSMLSNIGLTLTWPTREEHLFSLIDELNSYVNTSEDQSQCFFNLDTKKLPTAAYLIKLTWYGLYNIVSACVWHKTSLACIVFIISTLTSLELLNRIFLTDVEILVCCF